MARIALPDPDGGTRRYVLRPPGEFPALAEPFANRSLFAAAHVVADGPQSARDGKPPRVDWEATIDQRRFLWAYGFGVAEAMDTAQRGMGMDWETSRELITRSSQEARRIGGRIACGVGTDQLEPPYSQYEPPDITQAYLEQLRFVEDAGGQAIIMASRALAAIARGPGTYSDVYADVLSQAKQPVILHWLGPMFDSQLAGYWGSRHPQQAVGTVLQILQDHRTSIDGIKMSLLDMGLEVSVRSRLPAGVRMYTGDDFNFAQLIKGDRDGFSHGLLGIFDAIAPAAATAMKALELGDDTRYDSILAPTVTLSQHIFEPPTQYYKVGLVFLAYLNGRQPHFTLVNRLEVQRSRRHLVRLFILADRAGLLDSPSLAVQRMETYLESADRRSATSS